MQNLERISTDILAAIISGPVAAGYLKAGAPILTPQGAQQTAELDFNRAIEDSILIAEKLTNRVKETMEKRKREAAGREWAMSAGGTSRNCRHGIEWAHPCEKCAAEDFQRLNESGRG